MFNLIILAKSEMAWSPSLKFKIIWSQGRQHDGRCSLELVIWDYAVWKGLTQLYDWSEFCCQSCYVAIDCIIETFQDCGL